MCNFPQQTHLQILCLQVWYLGIYSANFYLGLAVIYPAAFSLFHLMQIGNVSCAHFLCDQGENTAIVLDGLSNQGTEVQHKIQIKNLNSQTFSVLFFR